MRAQVKERDTYWSDLLLNMAEGRIAEVAVLERMSLFQFYGLYKAWVKRHQAIMEANKQQ